MPQGHVSVLGPTPDRRISSMSISRWIGRVGVVAECRHRSRGWIGGKNPLRRCGIIISYIRIIQAEWCITNGYMLLISCLVSD